MATKGTKSVITASIDTEIIHRLDAIAAAQRLSRSTLIERLIRDGIEGEEIMVKAFANPLLRDTFVKMFGNKQVLKQMAGVLVDEGEVNADQLRLFGEAMEIAAGAKPAPKWKPPRQRKKKQ